MNRNLYQLHVYVPVSSPPEPKPALLFVHGAYTGAAMWGLKFIPWFLARGYTCYALDLAGHGQAAGRNRLDGFGLEDYRRNLAGAVAEVSGGDTPLVLVGHSMGALVVQRYLEGLGEHGADGRVCGQALLAPVPPSGTSGSAMRLALRYPEFFEELPKAIMGVNDEQTMRTMAAVYFSPGTSIATVMEILPLIQPESQRAVLEMAAIVSWSVYRRPRIPTLVMGGDCDQVFPASLLYFTAQNWDSSPLIIAGASHMLSVDKQWETSARALERWVSTLFPA
ncbi:alpha/beta fold hydrolase [Candidatus Thiothrix sp. Deng01]|uniref:Alpha/beta fold hydrolase n=1 Tax=Candidatus Thiothrix phosphatis TaxID=3112415 RepID=A0ABU6CVD6_9GAMM|nr:alpha/beta fold hydrolase [Candidatus Thiothrix sp. Deng01]MEB4590791.1 alpha/beta fold hydrolase [Candidatus Thiothrix sp. Deng01]